MSLIIAAVTLLLALQSHGASGAKAGQPAALAASNFQTTDPVAADSAKAWVALLDQQDWDKSWRVASSLFRSKLSSQQWASMVQPIRQPLGTVSSRIVQSTSRTASLPGAPPGDYDVVQFLTGFANKPGAVETVVLAREGVEWKVSGYFIR